MLGSSGMGALTALIERGSVVSAFDFGAHANDVLQLMTRYSNVPMAFAHACLVRMSEILSDPILLTTDSDFRVYRRNGRQVVPCVMPR
ncbi:MAG: uncharacterized protein QOF14_4829 [Hyphomicrobiales bacterium]|nr:uncharacterized protein [Hyphomicrobiales bacterium]